MLLAQASRHTGMMWDEDVYMKAWGTCLLLWRHMHADSLDCVMPLL